jgi:aspartate-semialdehyde dehydrogenase
MKFESAADATLTNRSIGADAPAAQFGESEDSPHGGIKMSDKLRVAVLGGTGMVGQRFIALLQNHPWFEVTEIAASPRSAGKTYEEAVGARWKLGDELDMPENVKNIVVKSVDDVEDVTKDVDFCFSALNMPKEEIKGLEERYAKTETPVVSNNSAHRWTPDVPMVIPEINPEHVEVIAFQKKRLGTERGFIAVKPNCSIQSYTPALAAWKEFEPYEVVVTTYQAISGAGKNFSDWPEMQGNIIPFISGEEEKSEKEPLRVFGHIENGVIVPAVSPVITSQCIRVPVLYGHTAAAFVKFRKKAEKEELIAKLESFSGVPQQLQLPSAPKQFIRYMTEDDRPQVLADVNYEHGMGVSIGRLRPDTVYDYKFIGLSHNTVRGAAGGGVECAELLKAEGYIAKK